jgi:hypothetical protein
MMTQADVTKIYGTMEVRIAKVNAAAKRAERMIDAGMFNEVTEVGRPLSPSEVTESFGGFSVRQARINAFISQETTSVSRRGSK